MPKRARQETCSYLCEGGMLGSGSGPGNGMSWDERDEDGGCINVLIAVFYLVASGSLFIVL